MIYVNAHRKIRDNNYEFPADVPLSDEAKNLITALLTPLPCKWTGVAFC